MLDLLQEPIRERLEQGPLVLEMIPEVAFRDAALGREICSRDIAKAARVEQFARRFQDAFPGFHQALGRTITGTSV